MSFSETISPFLGRCAFVWFFLALAHDLLADWPHVVAQVDAHHLPVPPLWVVAALLIIFVGCVSLFFGYQTRYGAMLLFVLTLTATFLLHDYWHYELGSSARAAEFGVFIRDFAISGGLLLMVGMGPGPFAIDNRGKGGGRKR